jgi:hypothetical protein
VKRALIALVLGSLLVLSSASVAAAKAISLGQLNAQLYPDTGSARTVIDETRSHARLRAIDMMFYPDSIGAERTSLLPDVGCDIAPDQCFGTAV